MHVYINQSRRTRAELALTLPSPPVAAVAPRFLCRLDGTINATEAFEFNILSLLTSTAWPCMSSLVDLVAAVSVRMPFCW